MALVRKTVHVPIDDKVWEDFKVLALRRKKSVDGLVAELVYGEVAGSVFESQEGEKR